ncbi:sodium-dependent transporter [Eggerthia catenaformis]|uniref:sodium-dependent transporter n=1 Tax=Eggerthia catenaformis TaxID=31973 RepID=UPI00047AB52C|nr:sodium-dependent transporter [Eggerthia catenaformis]
MEREKLGSRLGFILLSAGCAIGIGNVWKFPYMTGQNGGGFFVLFYLLFLVLFGVPIMAMEFSVGRAARKSPVKMFQKLEKKGTFWHFHGYICMLGNYLLMMFYTVVAGWMLYYVYASITGLYHSMNNKQIVDVFKGLLNNPMILFICTCTIIISGFFILSIGLENGLEKVTKIMMLFLIVLIIILAIHSLFLKGGMKGLAFYLKPDFKKLAEIGIGNVVIGALTQAFFTLSIGMGSMAIFGSYINKEHTLLGESINVAFLDTFVALCSGLIIFPACAAYGVDVDSGPGLLFITLPNVFNHLPLGNIWGSLFFLFMLFAAFSTVLAVFETITACCMDLFHLNRKKACMMNAILMILLALPCLLGFNILSGIHPLGAESSILDLEDFIVSHLILPIGSMIFLIFCVSRYGWGWKNFIKEVNTGEGLQFKKWMYPYLKYILPIIIFIVFIIGIIK